VPQVEVKFDIDANGILSVTATDKGSGKKQDIKITGASTLPKDEVERMVGEADKFADEDKKRREAVDTKNQAESMLYQTEKQLKEFEAKVPEDVKSKLQAKMEELRTAVNADDVEGMKKGMETLQQEAMAMGQAMYSQAGAAGSPPPPGADAGAGSKPNDDNVIDAEFTDKQ
jgi:molecular chaperone DnaK (HSP70)